MLALRLVMGILIAMGLAPLLAPFPPMQDYPQHLLLAQILSTSSDPSSDYGRYFETYIPFVYSTFYLLTWAFTFVFPIGVAGKLTLCLYPALIVAVWWRLIRRNAGGGCPWGALLFVPLAFNQQYFLGNVNYLFALPMILLALLDYQNLLEQPEEVWPAFRQVLWQVALFMTHPAALAAYAGFAFVVSIWWHGRGTPAFVLKAVCGLGPAVALFLVASWLTRDAASGDQSFTVRYLPLSVTVEFVALMFTGMQSLARPDFTALGLWTALLTTVAIIGVKGWKTAPAVNGLYLWLIVLMAVGLFVLPFQAGPYTHLNTRASAILYLLIALLAAHVRIAGLWRPAVACLAAACTILSVAKQGRISSEIAAIEPIVQALPPKARILPLVFDNDSPELDRRWFDVHLHSYLYYHLAVASGFSPYVPSTTIHPVRYREHERRPAPGEYEPQKFAWDTHASDYQFFLVRNAPVGLTDYLGDRGSWPVTYSGPWGLFKRTQGHK